MLKFNTIIDRACRGKNREDKEQAQLLLDIKYEESRRKGYLNSLSIEEYKQLLDNKGIRYVEAEIDKGNGKTLHWIIPTLIFKNMTQKDINILFKV